MTRGVNTGTLDMALVGVAGGSAGAAGAGASCGFTEPADAPAFRARKTQHDSVPAEMSSSRDTAAAPISLARAVAFAFSSGVLIRLHFFDPIRDSARVAPGRTRLSGVLGQPHRVRVRQQHLDLRFGAVCFSELVPTLPSG